jgi:glutathione S-transferase
MSPDTLKLYHSTASPNSRRVRIFLTEKGLKVPLVAIDLGKGEQHSASYSAINPRRVVPTLVLEDGTAIGEAPAIMRYLDEAFPEKPLLGATPDDFNAQLEQVPFVAGERYSAADITTLVTLDFAKALELTAQPQHAALKRWYETVSALPSATA